MIIKIALPSKYENIGHLAYRHECFSVILFCKAYLYKITKTLDYFFILYLRTLYCVCTYFNHKLNHKN